MCTCIFINQSINQSIQQMFLQYWRSSLHMVYKLNGIWYSLHMVYYIAYLYYVYMRWMQIMIRHLCTIRQWYCMHVSAYSCLYTYAQCNIMIAECSCKEYHKYIHIHMSITHHRRTPVWAAVCVTTTLASSGNKHPTITMMRPHAPRFIPVFQTPKCEGSA